MMIIKIPDQGELFSFDDEKGKTEALLPTESITSHSPSLIELDSGDLLCAWFAGSAEGSGDVRIVGSRLNRGADRWSPVQVISSEEGHSLQNPFFFQVPGGPLWLFHTSQQTRGVSPGEWKAKVSRGEAKGTFVMQQTALIYRLVSTDNGQSWGSKSVFSGKSGSFCRHTIQVLSNGNWIFPMYYSFDSEDHAKSHGDDYSVVQISEDQGKTWNEYPVPQSRGRVQMSIIEIAEGRCIGFFRSRASDQIYKSVSADYGKTWTVPAPTPLPNNNASVHAIKLQSGSIAVVYNPYHVGDDPGDTVWAGHRYSVAAAISRDEGESFPWIREVEPGSGFRGAENHKLNKGHAYPCILQSRDGYIHIAYSYLNRKCIKYLRVTEEWIKSGG